ncbi:MAG: type IV pili twitching motility protein PilT [Phycisphaerae bacterium]|nr:type IV pili twitching motility protein PilT [Phycisphaerae bacterium]|tara:strand:- start:5600 stop:6655 length:1056 start_codon:yes stop_codon:yes gene_type:complete
MHLIDMLRIADARSASDLHLVPGHPPMLRINTLMQPTDRPVLTEADVQLAFEAMTTSQQRERFGVDQDLDLSFEVEELGRYRVNAHRQRGTIAMTMRLVKSVVPPLEALNLPDTISRLVRLPRGLVLVTGDTGSGKSTTLASMINEMNCRSKRHIITLEDPIEYRLESDACLIEQRELGADMPSFASGLKHALRQDPDIIFVGEMRDLETTSLALSAAETGHLVLSTLHTVNAGQTVERIIDMYPAGQQNQVRSMLGNTLQAVVSQTLFRRIDRSGMMPAVEILLCTPAVRNIIRESRTFEIPNVIETSRAIGMVSLDSSISELYFNGCISREDAIAQSACPEQMMRQIAA